MATRKLLGATAATRKRTAAPEATATRKRMAARFHFYSTLSVFHVFSSFSVFPFSVVPFPFSCVPDTSGHHQQVQEQHQWKTEPFSEAPMHGPARRNHRSQSKRTLAYFIPFLTAKTTAIKRRGVSKITLSHYVMPDRGAIFCVVNLIKLKFGALQRAGQWYGQDLPQHHRSYQCLSSLIKA